MNEPTGQGNRSSKPVKQGRRRFSAGSLDTLYLLIHTAPSLLGVHSCDTNEAIASLSLP